MLRKRRALINRRVIGSPHVPSRERIAMRRGKTRTEVDALVAGPLRITFGPALFVICVIAGALCFAGISWGSSYYLHPDERYITQVVTETKWPGSISAYFDSVNSPLNPFNNPKYTTYVYGDFPLLLAKFVGLIAGDTVYGNGHLPGRWLSAVSTIAMVAMAGWAARMLWGRVAGLFAATLLAFTALTIQAAHYATTDSMTACFVTATMAFVVYASRRRSWVGYIIAGLMLGLAAACKPTAAAAVGFFAIPILEQIRLRGWLSLFPTRRMRRAEDRFPIVLATLVAGFVALWTFRFAMPYAFLGPDWWSFKLDPRWTSNLNYWQLVQNGSLDSPPSIQWANRTPVLFMVDNMVRYGMAPGFGIATVVALGVICIRLLFSRRFRNWWLTGLTAWSLFNIVFYGISLVKVQRYIISAYPEMAMLAGWLLASLFFWARRRGNIRIDLPGFRRVIRFPRRMPRWLHPGFIFPALAVFITVVYGIAFTNIYLKPLSRVEASNWIYDNIPADSTITSEYWDDALPFCPTGRTDCPQYKSISLHLYDEDNLQKLNTLTGQLNEVDYIILSSRRLIASIDRMPYRWPMTTAYYQDLFNGTLGFDLVATFDSPPSIGPLTFNDRDAEESLTVYEHPTVYIFKKNASFDYHKTWTTLDTALQQGLGENAGLPLRPIQGSPEIQLLDAASQAKYYAAGTWNRIFSFDGWTSHWPALWWYLALQLLTVPAIPLLWRLLPGLPDRGYAIAKTLGLGGVAYIAWLIASLRLVEFGPIPIFIGWFALAILSGLAIFRHEHDFFESIRTRWLWIVATEVLFLIIFVLAVWIRARNPDLWNQSVAGDKPLDLAFFNATIRTPYFPPYDPWYSGGTIHTSYWGNVPWAVVTRITGIVPTTAYNLVVPSLFALLLINSWSVAAALISRLVAPLATTATAIRRTLRLVLLALVAPVLVGIVGNLDFVRLLGEGSWGAEKQPGSWPNLGGFTAFIWGLRNLFTKLPDLPATVYVEPTRVIPADATTPFPYFSFIFGDLEPQYLAMPLLTAFLAVVIAIASGIRDTPDTSTRAERPGVIFATLGGWKAALAAAIGGGFLCGMLMASSLWYFPPMLVLLAGTALLVAGTRTDWRSGWGLLRDVAVFTIAAAGASQVFWLPFTKHYGSLNIKVSAVAEQTTLADFLSINGLLVFAAASYIALELARMVHAARAEGAAATAGASLGIVISICCLVLAFATGNTSLLVGLLLVLLLIAAWYRQYDRAHLLLLALMGLALVVLVAPDWVRIKDDQGRTDTLFNFSILGWILLGVSGAVGLAAIFDAFARKSLTELSEEEIRNGQVEPALPFGSRRVARGRWGWMPRGLEIVWNTALVVLLVMASSYTALASSARFDDRAAQTSMTLNGLAYMDQASVTAGGPGRPASTFSLKGDKEAVRWLLENTTGLPVVLEAITADGAWGGRISSMTGLPTVIGWVNTERQQRPGLEPLINNRVADVNQIYGSLGTFDTITPLLNRYDVQYIYVGDLERAMYGSNALVKFDAGVASGDLTVVYQQLGVTIYRYNEKASSPPAPPTPSAATPEAAQ